MVDYLQALDTANAIPNNTQNMKDYRGRIGQKFSINITGRLNGGGTVWGTDIYTDDSDIIKAAIHAGAIQNGENKTVCAWILCDRISFIEKDIKNFVQRRSNRLKYNPKVEPNWVMNGRNIDNEEFAIIVSNGRELYGRKLNEIF